MDKANIEELKERLRGAAELLQYSDISNDLKSAADVIEEYQRKGEFYLFIWNTLGISQMRQLVDMYMEEQETTDD